MCLDVCGLDVRLSQIRQIPRSVGTLSVEVGYLSQMQSIPLRLLLLDVEHPSPVALIKEIYSNLSIHSDDSSIHFVISWIRAEQFVITLEIVAFALGVPLVQQPVNLYTESPPFDDIMSLTTGKVLKPSLDHTVRPKNSRTIHFCGSFSLKNRSMGKKTSSLLPFAYES